MADDFVPFAYGPDGEPMPGQVSRALRSAGLHENADRMDALIETMMADGQMEYLPEDMIFVAHERRTRLTPKGEAIKRKLHGT